jgi:hypothetical protein
MDWALSAHRAFSPTRPFEGVVVDGSYITLAENQHPHGFWYLEPLEAQWGLQCPLLGKDPDVLAEAMEDLFHKGLHRWLCVILSGIIPDTPLYESVRRRFAARAQPGMSRYVASLDGGIDGYLARRSRNQRKSITSATRAAQKTGIAFVDGSLDPPDQAFQRMLDVEKRSWKGDEDTGLLEQPMQTFCRVMLERLQKNRRLELLFAQKDGQDMGYIFGAVFGSRYRGLQFSYVEATRDIALGSAMQFYQIQKLCEQGVAEYDLGSTSPHYKTRWAEREIQSVVMILTAVRG